MSAARDQAALRACIAAGLRAKDGRGVWRVVHRQTVAMTAPDPAPSRSAYLAAEAAVGIGQHLRALILAAGFKP